MENIFVDLNHYRNDLLTVCFTLYLFSYYKQLKQTITCPLSTLQNEAIVEQPAVLTSLTQRLTDYATDFILRQVAASRPFLLYLAYHHVHFPQFASAAFRNSSRRGSFGDSVAEVDHSVGQLLTLLTELGVRSDTLVLLTSDNGPELVEEGGGGQAGSAGLFRCGKGTTWDGGHRVPALLSWPGHVAAGRRPEVISALDILPTLVSLATDNTALLDHLDLDGYDVRQIIIFFSAKKGKEYNYSSSCHVLVVSVEPCWVSLVSTPDARLCISILMPIDSAASTPSGQLISYTV